MTRIKSYKHKLRRKFKTNNGKIFAIFSIFSVPFSFKMLRTLSVFYSRCFRLSCVSILNIFFPLFEATFQIIFTLKTKICFNQFVSIHQIYKSNWHWFYNKQPLQACFDKICYLTSKLFQQFAASLKISSCSISDFHRLDATWCAQQTCYKLVEQTCQDLLSTSLMQVVN